MLFISCLASCRVLESQLLQPTPRTFIILFSLPPSPTSSPYPSSWSEPISAPTSLHPLSPNKQWFHLPAPSELMVLQASASWMALSPAPMVIVSSLMCLLDVEWRVAACWWRRTLVVWIDKSRCGGIHGPTRMRRRILFSEKPPRKKRTSVVLYICCWQNKRKAFWRMFNIFCSITRRPRINRLKRHFCLISKNRGTPASQTLAD